jgi:hypothetical protein
MISVLANKRLEEMIDEYEKSHGHKPQIIALGKTHLEDLQDYLEKRTQLYFDDIQVIEHNDPIGITMAHDNRER